jgi:hypothetical protein
MKTPRLQNLFYHEILIYSDLACVRATLLLAELIWGMTLLWPSYMFELPTYDLMAVMLPEAAWGVIFLTSAFLQGLILICRRYHIWPSVCFSLLNAVLWWTVVLSLYIAAPLPHPALSGEVALAVAASWIFIRSGLLKAGK